MVDEGAWAGLGAPVGFYSPLGIVGGLAFALLLAATPLFRCADAPPSDKPNRDVSLDGLRSFLALGVFYHHGALYHLLLKDGVVALPPTRLYALSGQVGVSVFFMITGLLFWGRLVAKGGRLDWPSLYIGRVFRIAPVYLLAVALMYAIVMAWHGGFRFESGWLRTLLRWLALGFFIGGDVNGDARSVNMLGVVWTLHYEWLFYAALLPLSLVAGRRVHLWASSGLLLLSLGVIVFHGSGTPESPGKATLAALFSAGMLAASLRASGRLPVAPRWALSLVCLASFATVFLGFDSAYATLPILGLAVGFLCIVSGADLFGLLQTRAAVRLGNLSYGIYILHGPILRVTLDNDLLKPIALSSPLMHWLCVYAVSALVLAAAAVAHVVLERRGIEEGKRLASALTKRRNLATA